MNDAFCCIHCSRDFQCFSVGRTTPKLPLSMERSRPHIIHGSLGQRESAPKRYLDRFSRFCIVHQSVQHTDTQTTLRMTSVSTDCICAMHVMRPNNKTRRLTRRFGRRALPAVGITGIRGNPAGRKRTLRSSRGH